MRAAAALQPWEMADARRQAAGSWPAEPPSEEHDDADAAATGVLSGEYQAFETSTMASALAHVVAGGGSGDGYPPWATGARGTNNPAAMARAGTAHGYGHGYGYGYSAAAPTPAHFLEAAG